MSRMINFEKKRNKNKFYNIAIIYLGVFIFVAISSYAYFVHKENDRIKEFILNYDKSSKVYYLQKDLFGGEF